MPLHCSACKAAAGGFQAAVHQASRPSGRSPAPLWIRSWNASLIRSCSSGHAGSCLIHKLQRSLLPHHLLR